MTIELYKSALCPRCAYAAKIIKTMQEENKDIKVLTYDITTNLKAFKEANISMIPSIKINGIKKSWIIPKEKEIIDFITKHKD